MKTTTRKKARNRILTPKFKTKNKTIKPEIVVTTAKKTPRKTVLTDQVKTNLIGPDPDPWSLRMP